MTAALLNALVAIYIYTLVPEFLLRFVCWLLMRTLYRLEKERRALSTRSGAALIVGNHVSFVDALVISAACRRPDSLHHGQRPFSAHRSFARWLPA